MGRNKCSRQISKNTVNPTFRNRRRRLCECVNPISELLIVLLAKFVLPYVCSSITSKYFKGNVHAFFMILIVTSTAWCHKTIRTFFSVFLKICSPAGAVKILSVVISVALFGCFAFITGCEKNLPIFKYLFK